MQTVHELSEKDKEDRMTFARDELKRIEDDPDHLPNLFFSDEARFHLHRGVNRQFPLLVRWESWLVLRESPSFTANNCLGRYRWDGINWSGFLWRQRYGGILSTSSAKWILARNPKIRQSWTHSIHVEWCTAALCASSSYLAERNLWRQMDGLQLTEHAVAFEIARLVSHWLLPLGIY